MVMDEGDPRDACSRMLVIRFSFACEIVLRCDSHWPQEIHISAAPRAMGEDFGRVACTLWLEKVPRWLLSGHKQAPPRV
jgi:hypothetical protein